MTTTPFNVQDYLQTPEERAAYLEAILEDGDADPIAAGLGEIARAIDPKQAPPRTPFSHREKGRG